MSHAIQVIDEQDNKESFPLEFIQQSDYFKGMMENPSYKQPFLLPLGIPTFTFKKFFEQSKSKFDDIPLEKLTNYFILANALLFTTIQNQLLELIYTQLNELPDTIQSVQAKKTATQNILQNILALPSDNFDDHLAKLIHKNIDPVELQQKIQKLVLMTSPELARYKDIVFALPLSQSFKPYTSILITKDPNHTLIFTGNRHVPSMSVNALNILLSFNQPYDWNSIYLCAADPNNNRLYINPEKIFVLYYQNHHSLISTIKLAHYFPENIRCTHAAFSYNNTKFTVSCGGSSYILDYNIDKFVKLNVPHKVFSSILLPNNLVLYRTFDRKTYLYDIDTRTTKPIISALDYYINLVPENNGYRVYGIEDTVDKAVESSELIQI